MESNKIETNKQKCDKRNLNWNFDYEFNGGSHSRTKYVVYKIENKISGKVYIGQTRRELKERWKDYKNDLLKPIQVEKRSGTNIKLKRSVQKHYNKTGNLDFLYFSIVEVVDVTFTQGEEEKQKILNEREQYHIKEYRKLYGRNKVCNVIDGGKTYIFTESDKKSMSEIARKFFETKEGKLRKEKYKKLFSGSGNPMYGKKHLLESIEKNRKSNIGKQSGEKNPMYGKRHSDEAKKKVSEANKGKTSYWKGVKRNNMVGIKNPSAKIYDLSLNPLISPNGEQYNRIECLEDFCKQHSLTSSKMCQIISGKRKSHKKWHLQNFIF